MNEKSLTYKTAEVAELIGKPVTTVTMLIRQGKLKAAKAGKEYLIEKAEVNRYLGIESNEDLLKKDLYIKELESQIKVYKIKIDTMENLLKSAASVLQK
ncbi:MAG: helix-turn-helix domain-containing protein [Clostridiaceae bacterium]